MTPLMALATVVPVVALVACVVFGALQRLHAFSSQGLGCSLSLGRQQGCDA